MACITVPIDESVRERMAQFSWVNWSEVGREEITKREMFERYVRTRKLSEEDEIFCEAADWHPVDELPLKKEFAEHLKKIEKNHHTKPMKPEDMKKWLDKL